MLAKIIDFILTKAFIFVLCLLLLTIFISNIWLNIAVSSIVTIFISILSHIISQRKPKHTGYKAFEMSCIIQGNNYVCTMLERILSTNYTLSDDTLVSNNGKQIIIPSVKFGNVSADELLKLSRKYQDLDKIYLVAVSIDRKAQLIMHNFAKNIVFISLLDTYKYLKKRKMLPQNIPTTAPRKRLSKAILDVIFTRANIRRFLFVAVILLTTSLLLPFKTYYITLGGINVLLAIICLVRTSSKSHNDSNELFDKNSHLNR